MVYTRYGTEKEIWGKKINLYPECWDFKIDTGTVHNPHYYQHLQQVNNGQIPRNPNDILCGGLCTFQVLNYYILGKLKNCISSNIIEEKAKKKRLAEEILPFIASFSAVLISYLFFLSVNGDFSLTFLSGATLTIIGGFCFRFAYAILVNYFD